MYDSRVYDALDLTVYLDITDDVKVSWKAQRDIVVQVLLSDLIDDPTGKFLKVKLIQKKSAPISPAYFFDEGSTVEWTPNAEKLTTSAPGVKIASYDDEWFGAPVSVIEMDGKIDDIEEA